MARAIFNGKLYEIEGGVEGNLGACCDARPQNPNSDHVYETQMKVGTPI